MKRSQTRLIAMLMTESQISLKDDSAVALISRKIKFEPKESTMSKHADTQNLRLAAIKNEIAAVKAQAKALENISIEHHCGIDIGSNSPTQYFSARAEDLANSLNSVLITIEKMSEQRASIIEAFEKSARDLQRESAVLIQQRDAGAEQHFIEELSNTPKKVTYKDIAVVPDESREYKIQAHLHCRAAETAEVRSFVQQIAALCELCLEVLYVAAETASE